MDASPPAPVCQSCRAATLSLSYPTQPGPRVRRGSGDAVAWIRRDGWLTAPPTTTLLRLCSPVSDMGERPGDVPVGLEREGAGEARCGGLLYGTFARSAVFNVPGLARCGVMCSALQPRSGAPRAATRCPRFLRGTLKERYSPTCPLDVQSIRAGCTVAVGLLRERSAPRVHHRRHPRRACARRMQKAPPRWPQGRDQETTPPRPYIASLSPRWEPQTQDLAASERGGAPTGHPSKGSTVRDATTNKPLNHVSVSGRRCLRRCRLAMPARSSMVLHPREGSSAEPPAPSRAGRLAQGWAS